MDSIVSLVVIESVSPTGTRLKFLNNSFIKLPLYLVQTFTVPGGQSPDFFFYHHSEVDICGLSKYADR